MKNFTPVLLDETEHGKFYEGDSYLILRTHKSGNDFKWNIHFWLGRETTSDESGAAAILAVELDDSLGGAPVQHREVQEHETPLFISYFPAGVRYLPGGVASGFSHVNPNEPDPNEPKKLYHVKGKRNIRIKQVEASVESMNDGDCFILDAGKTIYVFHGRKSKKTERLKAINAGNRIRDQDHAGRSSVMILDEFSDENEIKEFFEELGSGSLDSIPDESIAGDDEKFEIQERNKVSLYRVSDSTGELQVEKLAEKPLSQTMLNTDDCFILDTITSGIFVWVGKRSTKKEKEEAMKKSEEFVKQKNYPKWTRITRVVEGGEPSTFKEYFNSWKESEESHLLERLKKYGIKEFDELGFDSGEENKMKKILKNGGTAFAFCPDDGDGSVEVHRIKNFELVPVEEENYGKFYGGDSYVIKYVTTTGQRIIYYWLGQESTQDERTAAAIQAVILDGEMDGAATIIRVIHGFEPKHFNKIFKGKMVIFSGGHASGFKNVSDNDGGSVNSMKLFRIRGTCSEDVRAFQLPASASSLNSNDVFYLETPEGDYIWFGKDSNSHEQEMAKNIPMVVSSSNPVVEIKEGEEPEEFFVALGGRADYCTEADTGPILSPRLYHFNLDKSVDEIFDFRQEDLEGDDVFVLKYGEEVYLWTGNNTTEEERVAAKKYFQYDDSGLCFLIYEGSEPESFRILFPKWNA